MPTFGCGISRHSPGIRGWPASYCKLGFGGEEEAMHYSNVRLSGCLGLLFCACALAAAGCENSDRRYEANYSYEVLNKSADGTVTVGEKGQVARATAGDAGGASGVNTKVLHI